MKNYNQFNSTEEPPQNFVVLSIIVTILCFGSPFAISFIFGIIGIYFGSKVNPAFYSGNIDLAEKNANRAKKFSLIGLALIVFNLSLTAYIYLEHPDIYAQQFELAKKIIEEYQNQAK